MLNVSEILPRLIESSNNLQSTLVPKKIIAFYGPPCAGKTTLSKKLSAEFTTPRITMDMIRTYIDPSLLDFSNQAFNKELFTLLVNCCDSIVSLGNSVICEALLIAEERKDAIRNIGLKHNIPVHLIYITAPLAVLRERLDHRHKRGLNSEESQKERLSHEDLNFFWEQSNPPKKSNEIIITDCHFAQSYEKVKQLITS